MLPAIIHDLLHLGALGNRFLHLACQLRQGNGCKLHIEFLQQLALIAHGAPEVKGPGADLQNPDVAEGLHHLADRQEIPKTPFKNRILQTAVGQVGKRYAKTAQHFTCGKQAALCIP